MPPLTSRSQIRGSNTDQLRSLRRLVKGGSARIVGKDGQSVEIPSDVGLLLAEIARSMESGKTVSVVAAHQELTTQHAANLLGVSRPFLVRLLQDRKLPFHMAGSHHRVYLADLLEFKSKRDRARHSAIKRLALDDVEAGTYDKVILPKGGRDE